MWVGFRSASLVPSSAHGRGSPLEGADGRIRRLAHDRILARPKFPSRASETFIVLARGVDIIARDYVKPQPKAEAGGGSRPGQGPIRPGLSDRAARAVTGSLTIPFIREPGAALALATKPCTVGPGPRPAPSGAWGGRLPSTTQPASGRAGVLNPDAESPRTGIVDRDSGPEETLPYGKQPNTRPKGTRLAPSPFIHCKPRDRRPPNRAPASPRSR